MTADPAALRALAARVESEEPTEALNEAVARALGWEHYDGQWWECSFLVPDVDRLPDYLTDLTAAVLATLRGLREPSNAVVSATSNALADVDDPESAGQVAELVRAMFDAAIAEIGGPDA